MQFPSRLVSVFQHVQAGLRFQQARQDVMESEPALRDELFNEEQMARHGAELASRHTLRPSSGNNRLLDRLTDNERVLSDCCTLFSAAAADSKQHIQITPAGEWLLDNYWMVEEQIHTARKHLPKGYSAELPQLAEGPSAGLPRVYDIALENVSHGDGRLDSKLLVRFVKAYQSVSPLTLGELWAIPIMLRLALIENLRRVATRVMADWQDQNLAAKWGDILIETADKDRKRLVIVVAEMAASNPPMTSAFVAELSRRLQGQHASLALPLNWIEEQLVESGASVDRLIQQDTQQQAANQVSTSNSMGGLRLLASLDWREFVESMSLVEQTLRKDPVGVYAKMDFASRDAYRHTVERLARSHKRTELDVARMALDLASGYARRNDTKDPDVRRHVGFYLVGDGRPVLRALLAGKGPSRYSPGKGRKVHTHEHLCLGGYLGTILLFSILLSIPFFVGMDHTPLLLALAAVPIALLAVSQAALKVVNWLVTAVYTPHVLPRLDYSHGIPPESRTVVVIPTLIGSEEDVESLMDRLEVQYLANRGGHIQFGLLTDFKDAPVETQKHDADLLCIAEEGIRTLNGRYPGNGVDSFFLCHRPRRWNETEQVWMGYERKRGKLDEFTELLRGKGRERFSLIAGNTLGTPQIKRPPVRYVITLDTDTILPRDAARKLAGSMAHPLNRPVFDQEKRRVTSGYAIMQPRVAVTLPSANRSLYAKLFADMAGVDPYTRSVSDVYQDMFQHGSYTGKGIYDVEAFRAALHDRFPENRILSHDLIEGSYARSGLVSDVLVYEDYPSSYSADAKRRHRWIRGDWQIAPWLLRRVPTKDGSSEPNPLSALARWKLLDNLRRSLVPLAVVLLLLLGWFASDRPIQWTLAFLGAALVLPVANTLQSACRKDRELTWKQHARIQARAFGRQCLDVLLLLAWLPHEAAYYTDAVVRTLWRMKISGNHLLQWNPSADTERTSATTLSGIYREMIISPILGILLIPALGLAGSCAGWPFALLWIVSPALAWRLSRPRQRRRFLPNREQDRFLRALSRRTWAFFEAFVGEEDNWLPPDNVQERPARVVAHRTSPTNMGLSLLVCLAARDFGYITSGTMLERVGRSLGAMSRLKRYRGHFYNWYDTRTLETMQPEYISSVDSGNLAGHLIVLRQGLHELENEPLIPERLYMGLEDTALVLDNVLPEAEHSAWIAFMESLEKAKQTASASLYETVKSLRTLETLAENARHACLGKGASRGEEVVWFDALLRQCRDLVTDLELFVLPPSVTDPALQLPSLGLLACMDVDQLPTEARNAARTVQQRAKSRVAGARELAGQAASMAFMDFSFLYDKQRELLSIGYSVNEQRLDASYYDLLASEARLTYFVAVAQGQLPQDCWFALGRLLTDCGRTPVLLSWSGSMFEYLMPILVMPSYEGSLLDTSCEGAVHCQIEYGKTIKRPWGISESAYFMQDAQYNYQYKAFGVPGLGLKRGLADEVVIAPYATVMALMVAPEEACSNLQALTGLGLAGQYGMYESADFTRVRLPRGHEYEIMYSYMVHHQGMSFLSLARLLLGNRMQRRFLADPYFQAAKLLLEERMPKVAPEYLNSGAVLNEAAFRNETRTAETRLRVFKDPDIPVPTVQLLSNGSYHVMVSNSGAGYSRYGSYALTRWREDATRDNWGMFCYVRDVESGRFWSSAYQPVCRKTESFEAIFSEARAEFRTRQDHIDTHTEIVVSPEDNCELRRVHVSNKDKVDRLIELTSYGEVVLAPPMADDQHQAFSKLFVQTELVRDLQAIVCTRRPRSSSEERVWMFHLLAAHSVDLEDCSYETNRSVFLGRGRTPSNPEAMDAPGPLPGSEGAVLDPVVSIRCRMRLKPGQTAIVDLVTGAGETREDVYTLMHKFRDKRLADRIVDLAWTHSQVLLHQFNATVYNAHLYEQMAASIIYANGALRASPDILRDNRRGQPGLWGQGISGDNPIVLLMVSDTANIDSVRQMVKAHAYWRMKGLTTDLVVWNEDHMSYRQNLHDLILSVIPSGMEGQIIDRPGGIFVRAAQQMSREDRILLQSVARLVLSDTAGTLADQVFRRRVERRLPGLARRMESSWQSGDAVSTLPENGQDHLMLTNSLGGFTGDGREYVIRLQPGETTPAPWVNVLANERFGTIVSEGGSAYTWLENAHEFRLTPWMNDPVSDESGEIVYLRDEEDGRVWSPTPLPDVCRAQGRAMTGSGFLVRHGFGYTSYEHVENGIATELTVCVAARDPVKFWLLKVRNVSGRSRNLSTTGYVEWVLGDLRPRSSLHVNTELDRESGCILAHTPYATDFPGRTAFFGSDARERTFTCDRTEFLGRNGGPSNPAALGRFSLSGRSGAGFDPCAAIQSPFFLHDGESREILFILGSGDSREEAQELCKRYTNMQAARNELAAVRAAWDASFDVLQVSTPDPAVNVLLNGWLLYQSVSSRFLGRSGFYQSGGAYGFRDQLQDTMAMVHAWPALVREHLLRSAAHQFVEGDAMHWWHPPVDRGVRTRCSDDYLWLPFVAERYVRVTGDATVLDEIVEYIEGRPLNPDEESYYDLPARSHVRESLYDHCVRAIRHGLRFGQHGLPLMGSGDWNDGMDRVGIHGQGESVWLGFFLYAVLTGFIPLAEQRGDAAFASECREQAETLRQNLERNAWDGEWYRRAYFDDGTPLGSSENEECRIDSIAQSWSVLSGAGDKNRSTLAMQALDQYLVRRDLGIIQLFTPPFNKVEHDPGYIKGYVPGVRENGGQYTHGAVWAVMAFAALGDRERAWELASMINPVHHGDSREAMERYKVEPYVIAADVYAVQGHEGQGGWTWYTGSASWMYRLLLESLLGMTVADGRLYLAPLLPQDWREITIRYRHGSSLYVISIRQQEDARKSVRLLLDGEEWAEDGIPLEDDGREHTVEYISE